VAAAAWKRQHLGGSLFRWYVFAVVLKGGSRLEPALLRQSYDHVAHALAESALKAQAVRCSVVEREETTATSVALRVQDDRAGWQYTLEGAVGSRRNGDADQCTPPLLAFSLSLSQVALTGP
jgi:hypothetical protein